MPRKDFLSPIKMGVDINYVRDVPVGDPETQPCRIIGKLANLQQISYSQISACLGDKVDEQTWNAGVQALSSSDTCSLYLNQAIVASLPQDASRHNTPSRSHALVDSVISLQVSGALKQTFVIVCERSEVYALGCAVARAFPRYSEITTRDDQGVVKVAFVFVGDNVDPLNPQELFCLENSEKGIRTTQYIVDAPCSEMNTDAFIAEVERLALELNINPFIVRGEDLKSGGFGGIYGVGKAAAHPPALIVLSHTPQGATRTIAWCGKGIVYDTGGLSIKSSTNMLGMKRDCGGAAGILGAFYAAVKLGFTQNLHAVLCMAENAVGPDATRPDDVHILYSGKSVEINNTDAEGRLVLGDGVAYARKDLNADIVVDMATLTGAQGISTGRYHAAIVTNNGDIEQSAFDAGKASGELAFPLPYSPELHFKEFKSVLADMKNLHADGMNAQSSCAGLFIGAHLGFDYPGIWLHVDMAFPAYSGERATGYGVGLLNTLFGSYSSNPLLNAIAPGLPQAA